MITIYEDKIYLEFGTGDIEVDKERCNSSYDESKSDLIEYPYTSHSDNGGLIEYP